MRKDPVRHTCPRAPDRGPGLGILDLTMDASDDSESQLAVLGELHELFEQQRIDYWVFGGWAVDFHAGRVTRPHADIDVAVWMDDLERIGELLGQAGWHHAPLDNEDGYTQYAHEAARLELAFLARDVNGVVYTPIQDGRGDWPLDAFGEDVAALLGVQVHVVSLSSLLSDKLEVRSDPSTRAKDRADVEVLLRVARGL
jgi:aminoglycoside-2''-adenylyltransferase